MAGEFGIDNAIGYAHLQLRGGWKNVATTTAAYAVLIGGLIFVTVRISPSQSSQILSYWVVGLLGLQTAMLMMFGCLTVGAALKLDLSTGVIESHRMMPVPPAAAISGYVFGATCQAISLAAATFIIGAIVAAGGHVAFVRWLMPNVILFTFAVFVWVMIVFFGFIAPNAFRWIAISLSVGTFMSQGMILTLLPGAMLLLSPLMGNSIFAMRTATSELRWEHILAFSSQFLIGAILYIGAMRKYRRADAQALTTWLGLLLLAGWVAISATSIFHWDDVAPRFLRSDMSNNLGRFVASLASAMLLALVPVGAAAWADADWRRGKEADDPELGRRPVSPLLASLIAAVVILLLCVVAPEGLQFSRPQIVRSAIVVTAFLLALSYLLRIRHRANQKTMLLGVAWIILTWVGPVAIDLTRHGMSADSDDQVLSVISTCSPIASLAQIWSKDALGKSNVGLVAQTAMAAMLMLWFYTMRPARKPIV
jgi:hypothetical protein